MCGIAGIISLSNNHLNKLDESNIDRTLRLIRHRGPDASGKYIKDKISLGHVRLSIIDLSNDADQPMSDDFFHIVYNGEIYNYEEVRNRLIALGYSFKTSSDTEVILKAYREWGSNCVSLFNGMWSFVIYDDLKKVVFISRDRFGIKPFYYTIHNEKFIFCSEIKGILPFLDLVEENEFVLLQYLYTGKTDTGEETFFKNIKQLLPSSNLEIDLNKSEFKSIKYYTLQQKYINENEGLVDTKLDDAIHSHVISDVPICYCLSGGLDSSNLVLHSKNVSSCDNQTTVFTIGNAYEDDLDTILSKRLADDFNLKHNLFKPNHSDFLADIDSVIYNQDEPFDGTSIFVQNYLMKMISNNGYKVVIDGQGADELFLGYTKYIIIFLFEEYKKYGFYKAFKLMNDIVSKNSHITYFSIFNYLAGAIFPQLIRYKIFKDVSFLKNQFKNKMYLNIYYQFIKASLSGKQELQQLEIFSSNLPSLLRYEDRNSMANSIESRVPYLDYRFVEFAYSLPLKSLIKDGYMKGILRSTSILPEYIRNRKKKLGFDSPISEYESRNRKYFNESILNSDLIKKYSKDKELIKKIDSMPISIKWRLFNISIWEKHFLKK